MVSWVAGKSISSIASIRWRKPADFIPDAAVVPLKRIKKGLFIKRLQTVFFTAILACAIAAVAFGILTSPKFFPYSDGLFQVIDGPDGSITITFENKVTGYSCMKEFDNETETEIYRINAWTTTWDLHSSHRGRQNMVIPSDREPKICSRCSLTNSRVSVLTMSSA